MTEIEFYQKNSNLDRDLKVVTPIGSLNKKAINAQSLGVEDILAVVHGSRKSALIKPRLLFEETAFLTGVNSGIEKNTILFGIDDSNPRPISQWEPSPKVQKYNLLEGRVVREWQTDAVVEYIFRDANRVIAPDNRGWETFELKYLDASRDKIVFSGHLKEIVTMEVLESANLAASSSADNTVKIWNLQNGDCLETIKVDSYAARLIFPNASVVIGGEGYPNFWIWSREKQEFLLRDDNLEINPSVAAVDDSSQLVVVAKEDGTTSCYSLLDGEQIWSVNLAVEIDYPLCIVPVPELSAMALSGEKGYICLIDTRSGEIQTILKGGQYCTEQIIVIGKQGLIAGNSDETIRVWNVQTGKCVALLVGHIHEIKRMKMTDDYQHLIAIDKAGRVISWNSDWQNLLHCI